MKATTVASILSLCLAGYAKASCGEAYAQCGGINFVGENCCVAGTECVSLSETYYQCLPVENSDEEEVEVSANVEENEADSNSDVEETEFPRGQGMQFFTQCKNPKHWAMTYDDGPTMYADIMLDLFKKYDIKVTFFVCGNLYYNLEDPEWARIIKRMYNEGHLIGNHTYNHLDMSTLTAEEITSEMKKVENALYNTIGVRPAFMRLPYGSGASSPVVMDTLAANGYNAAINWNVDTVDWGNSGDIEYSIKVITEQLGNPIITLNHLQFEGATNERIVDLATAEIEYLLSKGYTPVRMDECLGMAPYQE
ncbi:glycoside hydrolase/deacetylase [Piromyces finnis]|uniref:Glycoside hydrolase/deacetylase n=1 Tax=Piromyces finnis TaxID=1754191 RepID=A0A1Y1V1N1_9FUNG|nr:glycoside hydrolase/deacetylase [Piromyces finnis]|eukprot:ORX44660.1 glycoside hydrolase/deacetylase [Piromyces finnis]